MAELPAGLNAQQKALIDQLIDQYNALELPEEVTRGSVYRHAAILAKIFCVFTEGFFEDVIPYMKEHLRELPEKTRDQIAYNAFWLDSPGRRVAEPRAMAFAVLYSFLNLPLEDWTRVCLVSRGPEEKDIFPWGETDEHTAEE